MRCLAELEKGEENVVQDVPIIDSDDDENDLDYTEKLQCDKVSMTRDDSEDDCNDDLDRRESEPKSNLLQIMEILCP